MAKINRQLSKIINLAEPYYKRGRAAEKYHHLTVAGMMQQILKEKRGVDPDVMMASALLHDTGYSKIPPQKRAKHWNRKVKKDHMMYGAKIAKAILKKINFPKDKIQKVCEIISTHDNPEIGLQITSREGKILKEADILWMTTEEAFWLDVGRRTIDEQKWFDALKKRFTQDESYTKYLTTKFSRKQVKKILKLIELKLKSKL